MSFIFQSGKTALITGGASGIGLALAKRCVQSGMRVLIADRDAGSLAAAPKAIGGGSGGGDQKDGQVLTYSMDVASLDDWAGLRDKVQHEFGGKLSLLALNAGVGPKTSFEDGDPAGFHRLFETNLFGVVNGITSLLPFVKATASTTAEGGDGGDSAPSAAVVITGSKQGITNPPGNPGYNASKAAVKALAEHLSYDLASTPIAVHLLVPGWTWTGLAGGVAGQTRDNYASDENKAKPEAAWWPEQVVEYLETKMEERQFWVLCPDNEVTEDMDRKRMLWSAGDAVEGRKPLSRWRGEYKGDVDAWMKK